MKFYCGLTHLVNILCPFELTTVFVTSYRYTSQILDVLGCFTFRIVFQPWMTSLKAQCSIEIATYAKLIYCLCFLLCLFLLYKWQFEFTSVGLCTKMLMRCVFYNVCTRIYILVFNWNCVWLFVMSVCITLWMCVLPECRGCAAGAFCSRDEV